jgi:hypothetical protein
MRRFLTILLPVLLAGCAAHTEPPLPGFRYETPVRIAIVNEWSEPPREVYIATFFTHNQQSAAESDLDLGTIAIDRIRATVGQRPGVELEVIPTQQWTDVTGKKLRFRRINPEGDRIFESYVPDLEARIRAFAAESGFDIVVHLQSNQSSGSSPMTNGDVRHWGAVTQGYVKSPSQHYAFHHLTVRLHSVDPPYYMGDGTADWMDFETITPIDHECQNGVREGIYQACREIIEWIVLDQVSRELEYALHRLGTILPGR